MLSISEHTFFEENLRDITVVDLGACEGAFMKGLLNSVSVKKYIAVEANPVLYQALAGNESDKIAIINAAVVESTYPENHMVFNVDPSSIYNSSAHWKKENWEAYKVETISLKKIFEKYNLEKIDILKMDIEGAEWAILDEFDETYFNRINQITVEFHDFVNPEMRKRTKQVVKKMRALGYRHIYKGIEYLHNSVYYDSLFYKSDKKETIWSRIRALFKPNEKYTIN
jgi:FkbM family methyltransferase